MNTLTDNVTSANYEHGFVFLKCESGLEVKFPVAGNPRLENASAADLSQIEISPFGIHWPTLDEDLSFRGIFAGKFGQR